MDYFSYNKSKLDDWLNQESDDVLQVKAKYLKLKLEGLQMMLDEEKESLEKERLETEDLARKRGLVLLDMKPPGEGSYEIARPEETRSTWPDIEATEESGRTEWPDETDCAWQPDLKSQDESTWSEEAWLNENSWFPDEREESVRSDTDENQNSWNSDVLPVDGSRVGTAEPEDTTEFSWSRQKNLTKKERKFKSIWLENSVTSPMKAASLECLLRCADFITSSFQKLTPQ